MSNAKVPQAPPAPPVRKSVAMPVGPDLNRQLPVITAERAAVMRDIRSQPQLRHIPPSLINDRSESKASDFYQPENGIKKLITDGKENVTKPPSGRSASALSNGSGYKVSNIKHPASKPASRTPTPDTVVASTRSRASSRSSLTSLTSSLRSSMQSLQILRKRSPSPPADYSPVLGLYPKAAKFLTTKTKSTEILTESVSKAAVTQTHTLKRPAPKPPATVQAAAPRYLGASSPGIPQKGPEKFSNSTISRKFNEVRTGDSKSSLKDHGSKATDKLRATATPDSSAGVSGYSPLERALVFTRLKDFPTDRHVGNGQETIGTRRPAPAPPTVSSRQDLGKPVYTEFEARYTFRTISELPTAQRVVPNTQKTYPSQYRYN